MAELGAEFWPLRLARELDDAILDIRANELDVAAIVFTSSGDPAQVLAYDSSSTPTRSIGSRARSEARGNGCSNGLISLRARWLLWSSQDPALPARLQNWCLPRIAHTCLLAGAKATTSRSATFASSERELRRVPMSNGLSSPPEPFSCRSRQCRRDQRAKIGEMIEAQKAQQLGLVTVALDDIDWEDEIRIFMEERASFSPDALTGLEANLRFAGPETMESKIFARLTAWQNWIFQRPNAVGEEGALNATAPARSRPLIRRGFE